MAVSGVGRNTSHLLYTIEYVWVMESGVKNSLFGVDKKLSWPDWKFLRRKEFKP